MITAQMAYIKGLNDAENTAKTKITSALNGQDDGPFNNPEMEELRQRILRESPAEKSVEDTNKSPELKKFGDIESILLGNDYFPEVMTIQDMEVLLCVEKLVELINQCIKKKTKDGLQMEAVLNDFKKGYKAPLTNLEKE